MSELKKKIRALLDTMASDRERRILQLREKEEKIAELIDPILEKLLYTILQEKNEEVRGYAFHHCLNALENSGVPIYLVTTTYLIRILRMHEPKEEGIVPFFVGLGA